MPTLNLADGSTLTWGETTQVPPIVTDAEQPVVAPAEVPTPEAPASVTADDVQAALAKVPPKWVATFWRFAKTLGAGLAAAFVVAGGSIESIAKDPTAFLTAVGAAVVMAIQKFASWKD